jgi:glycosyltransferase involved in cell wall biosynthesis
VFLGNRTDVERVLHTFDISVNSSILEGMANSILEAMASGVAVVASDIPGNREVLADGAMDNLFTVGDSHALAVKLLELFDSPARREALVAKQMTWARENFSIDVHVDRYARFYRMVNDTKGGRLASPN